MLNTNTDVLSRYKVCMAGRTKRMAVLSRNPKASPHCDLTGKRNIPVSKFRIFTVPVRLSKKNINSLKCNLFCSRVLFLQCHVLKDAPAESSHDDRTRQVDQRRTVQQPREMQCVPVQGSVHQVPLHRHHPGQEPLSAE